MARSNIYPTQIRSKMWPFQIRSKMWPFQVSGAFRASLVSFFLFYLNSDLVTFISYFLFSFTSAVMGKSLYRLHVGIWQFYLMTAAHWLCSTRLNNNKKPSQISIQLNSSSSNIDVGIDVNSRNFQFH